MNPKLLIENSRRYSQLTASHDPARGIGAVGERVPVGDTMLPAAMMADCPDYERLTPLERERLRIGYDFEYWCWRCVKIEDKATGRLIPFVLNQPQRKLLAVMERQRTAGEPVRIILLKARQWGGSTLVQIYIAWHQIVLYKGKHSVIVGHKRSSSYAIKKMLRTLIKNYPPEFLDEGEELKLANVPDANDIQEITGRDCTIGLTSSFSPDASRGQNLSLAHLSEVAFWKSTRNLDPNDLIRSITGSILLTAGTIIVLESTANGINSFFYNEWKRAVEGKSVFKPVFVAWSEIALYQKPLDEGFDYDKCDSYEQALWDSGCCLEQIYWYHEKRKEYSEHNLMKAEFPSTSEEAFESSVKYVFSQQEQDQILENVAAPVRVNDDEMSWLGVNEGSRYLCVLTIGSETDSLKPSVISVWNIDRDATGRIPMPELAASWQGNSLLNLLAIKAMKMAVMFNHALLVIDNNDLSSGETDKRQGEFIYNELMTRYRKIYRDTSGRGRLEVDRNTFPLMFYELIVNAKNQLYNDHDEKACKAVSQLTILPNGRYSCNDTGLFQLIVNRAEFLYVLRDLSLKASKPYSHEDMQALTARNMY